MRDVVRAYIEKYRLLTENRPVLVGVSGGADSIALLTILVESGYSCIAAHCNFHLRGDESLRDEQFVREYARKLDVPFLMTDFDTRKYAADRHLSIEMAARELRYGWFEEQRAATGAQAVAVAHHRDDSVETLLMNLVRGTGIRGMSGIRPRNGFVVRPLLAVSREDILEWLAGRGLTYVTDSTNLSDAYTRNFIRLRVLPLLKEINPSVKDAIARTSEHLSAAEAVYLHVVEEARNAGRARGPPFDCRLDALPVARCYFIRVTQNLWLYSSGGGGCLFVPDERIGQNLFLFYAPVDKRSGLFIVISPCKRRGP